LRGEGPLEKRKKPPSKREKEKQRRTSFGPKKKAGRLKHYTHFGEGKKLVDRGMKGGTY